jgi:hypothetical protein
MSSHSNYLHRNNNFFIGQSVSSLCSSPSYEVFESNDEIKTFSDVRLYLLNCGISSYSAFINSVDVLKTDDKNYNIFIVSYCCLPEYDATHEICHASWSVSCDSSAPELNLSFACLDPHKDPTPPILNNWYFDFSSNTSLFHKSYQSCSFGCNESTLSGFEPTLSEGIDACSFTPTATTTILPPVTPTPFTPIPIEDAIDTIDSIHIAGDYPNFSNEVCFGASTEVLLKPNSSDASFRSFYFLTNNGYFYEAYEASLVEAFEPYLSKSLTFPTGESVFFVNDFDNHGSFYHDFKSTLSYPAALGFMDFIDFYDDEDIVGLIPFCNIITDSTPNYSTPTPDNTTFIKDESLIGHTYKVSDVVSNIYTDRIATLNRYWFEDLLDDLYPSTRPDWSDIFYRPTCSLITASPGHIYYDSFSFSNSFFVDKEYSASDLFIHSLKNTGLNFSAYSSDPGFNVDNLTMSENVEFELYFALNVDTSLVSSSYSGPSKIERKEKVTINLRPRSGTTHTLEGIVLQNSSVDCVKNIPSANYQSVKGFGIRVK